MLPAHNEDRALWLLGSRVVKADSSFQRPSRLTVAAQFPTLPTHIIRERQYALASGNLSLRSSFIPFGESC